MGLYSLLRGIADRFRMAYLYPDQVIRVAKGIAEGAEISDEIKAKWRAESDRQVLGLMAQKERELKAQQAQQAYEAGLEPMEAFQDPDLVDPVPISDATTTPHELKQIQVDLTDLRKSIPNCIFPLFIISTLLPLTYLLFFKHHSNQCVFALPVLLGVSHITCLRSD